MARPYPSNLIIFNVDERVLDEDMKLALKRSWTHIADVLVRKREAVQDTPPSSFVRVMVKYGTRRYLKGGDAESDANWAERIEQHLLATMRKIANNAIAFNRRQRKTGDAELALDHIEFALEGGALTLEYRLDSNASLPTSCARIATDVRDALSRGDLSGDAGEPVRVRIPSARSYEAQRQAWAARKADELAHAAEEEALRQAEESAAREAAEEAARERFMESPGLAAKEKAAEDMRGAEARKDSPFEVAPLTDEEWEALYGVAEADFAIDYSTWEAIYADGTSCEFDSHTARCIA